MSYSSNIIKWLSEIELSTSEYYEIKKIILKNHLNHGESESEKYRRSRYEALDLNSQSEYDAHMESSERAKENVLYSDEVFDTFPDHPLSGPAVDLSNREVVCVSSDEIGLFVATEVGGVETKRTYLTNTALEEDV